MAYAKQRFCVVKRGFTAELHQGLITEYLPETPTEIFLIEGMAQHYWLKQRAIRLQTLSFDLEPAEAEKNLALFLRYQTTHEHARKAQSRQA